MTMNTKAGNRPPVERKPANKKGSDSPAGKSAVLKPGQGRAGKVANIRKKAEAWDKLVSGVERLQDKDRPRHDPDRMLEQEVSALVDTSLFNYTKGIERQRKY